MSDILPVQEIRILALREARIYADPDESIETTILRAAKLETFVLYGSTVGVSKGGDNNG